MDVECRNDKGLFAGVKAAGGLAEPCAQPWDVLGAPEKARKRAPALGLDLPHGAHVRDVKRSAFMHRVVENEPSNTSASVALHTVCLMDTAEWLLSQPFQLEAEWRATVSEQCSQIGKRQWGFIPAGHHFLKAQTL